MMSRGELFNFRNSFYVQEARGQKVLQLTAEGGDSWLDEVQCFVMESFFLFALTVKMTRLSFQKVQLHCYCRQCNHRVIILYNQNQLLLPKTRTYLQLILRRIPVHRTPYTVQYLVSCASIVSHHSGIFLHYITISYPFSYPNLSLIFC